MAKTPAFLLSNTNFSNSSVKSVVEIFWLVLLWSPALKRLYLSTLEIQSRKFLWKSNLNEINNVVVSFIGGGNLSTRRQTLLHKMLQDTPWHGQKSNYSGYWLQALIAQISFQVVSIANHWCLWLYLNDDQKLIRGYTS